MRIAITGANGQLGAELLWELQTKHTVLPLYHETFDLTAYEQMQQFFLQTSIDCIINAAGRNDFVSCEQDPLAAYAVNAVGVRDLARLCQRANAAFVHISCNELFDGAKDVPYVETDPTSPINTYANSKVAGEHFALHECEKSTVLRVGFLYGKHPCRSRGEKSFVEQVVQWGTEKPELYIPDGVVVQPTPTHVVAELVLALLEEPVYGIVHAACHGACSLYQLAARTLVLVNNTTPVLPAKESLDPEAPKRPSFSLLDNQKLHELGRDQLPFWEDALDAYLHA